MNRYRFWAAGLLVGCTHAGTQAAKRPSDPQPAAPTAAAAASANPVAESVSSVEPPTAQTAASTPGDTEPEMTAPPSESAGQQLPAGTVVLHIGDSFAGALGLDLNRKLEAAGNRGILKYRTASYIPGWASGKELQKYISDFHPDLVLVTLGANELGIGAPEQRAHAIHKLVNTIGDVPCVWIGPALWPGAHTQLLKVVEDNCAPCRYLDSTAYLPNLARAKDGIHPSTAAREEWAQFVVQWLTTHRDPQGPKVWSLLSRD